MDGPILNPTSRPSERPALGDSGNSAPGSHVVGKGGADEVATMAGMRATLLLVAAAVRKAQQCWCHQGLVGRSGGSDIGYKGRGGVGQHHGQVIWRIRTFPSSSH